MRYQFIENEDNPLQQSVRLGWDNMRDAATDAVLGAPSTHAEMSEPPLTSETHTTLYATPVRAIPNRKHITFRTPRHT